MINDASRTLMMAIIIALDVIPLLLRSNLLCRWFAEETATAKRCQQCLQFSLVPLALATGILAKKSAREIEDSNGVKLIA